jgi:pimeloyl-ACP methyl ester carboxylesterase
MKVIFSHGKESGPWGSKIKRLANCAEGHGCTVDSIDYTDLPDDADARVARLAEVVEAERSPPILVGSSMGGYVSLVSAEKCSVKAVFLLAPALYLPGYSQQEYAADVPVEIVHGWGDELIPPEHAIRYAQLSNNTLHLVDGDHRLTDALDLIEQLFDRFMAQTLGKI